MINVPEGRRALGPIVASMPEPAAAPTTSEIDRLRWRNDALAKTLIEILDHFEEQAEGTNGWGKVRRTGWVRESTFSRWKQQALEAGTMHRVPELLGQIVQEQAKHVFATLTTCTCGYAPVDNSDWSAHRAGVAVEVIAAWIEKWTSPRIDEQGPEPKLAGAWAAEMIREGLKS